MEAEYQDGSSTRVRTTTIERYVPPRSAILTPQRSPHTIKFSLRRLVLTTPTTEPNPDDAVEAKIAEQYKSDRTGYEKEAPRVDEALRYGESQVIEPRV